MRRLDELDPEPPFAGSRMRQGLPRAEGQEGGRLHVPTLIKRRGIGALSRRPTTSKPAPGHKVCPDLLRNLAAVRPNQVRAMDTAAIPMARGFVSLAAVADWLGRKVPAWTLSIALSAGLCSEAPQEAPGRHGRPETFNSDPGRQFASAGFRKVPKAAEIAISLDGKGAWHNNVLVERLWRTVKHEEVCLRA